MIYEIKQLEWKGKIPYASVRDYIAKDHISKKKTLRIVFNNFYMDLNPTQLKKHTVIIANKIKSIVYPDQYYYIYSYKWSPKDWKKEEAELKDKIEKGIY